MNCNETFLSEVTHVELVTAASCSIPVPPNAIALTELAGGGRDKPMCVLAEGSLVRRSRHYRPELDRLLTHCGSVDRGLRVTLHVGEEITLVGSAAAALLNAR